MAPHGATEHLDKIGRIAYEGYCEYTEWKSLATGDSLPQWEGLSSEIRAAWTLAAIALEEHFHDEWNSMHDRPNGEA